MSQPNNSQPNQPANPFNARPGQPSKPQAAAPAPAPASAPARPLSSPFGSRFGATKMDWRIVPVSSTLVRFDLDGLGDPFYRLLGKRLTVDFGNHETAIQALETGGDMVEEVRERLEQAWLDYGLQGAVLLYPWRKEIRQVLAGRTIAANDDEEEEDYDDDKRPAPTFLRAVDLHLVLNILARTRVNILLANSPLTLERQYLEQSFFTDDPRLVALAQATGCIEEPLIR